MSDFPPRHDNSENDVVSPFPSLVESRIQRTPPPDELESAVARDEETVAPEPDEPTVSAESVTPPRGKGAKSLWRRIPRPKRKTRGATVSQDPKPHLTPAARRLALPAAPAVEPSDDPGDAEVADGAVETDSTLDAASVSAESQSDTVSGPGEESGDSVDETGEGPGSQAVEPQDDERSQYIAAGGERDEIPGARAIGPQDDACEDGESPEEPAAEEVSDEKAASRDVVSGADDELDGGESPEDAAAEDAPAEKAASQVEESDAPPDSSVATPVETGRSEGTFDVAVSHGDERVSTALTSPPREDTEPGGSAEPAAEDESQSEPASPAVSGSFITALGGFRDTAPTKASDDRPRTAETVGAQDDQSASDSAPPETGQESTDDNNGDGSPGDGETPDASRQLATVGATTKPSVKPTSFRGPGLPTSLTSGRSVLRFTAPQIPSSLKLRSKSGSWQPSTPPRPLMPVSAPPQSRQAPRQFWPIVALLAMPAIVVLVVVLLLL